MKQFLIGLMLFTITQNLVGQTLDQDYISGIPATTSFGGHPLGADYDQGQSFTAGITGNLRSIIVSADISDPFGMCGPSCPNVGLMMEITNGDGFAGAVLGTSDLINVGLGQGTLTFNFSSSISLISGNTYTWEIKRISESCQGVMVSLDAESSGTYGDGTAYNNGSQVSSGQDILFQTYIGNYTGPLPDAVLCTLDQDYITGIPATTSFGGHPLGADNDQGQSFTSNITGNLQGIEVVVDVVDFSINPCSIDFVNLEIELHDGD
ncbi:MAG: hypothetical protein JKX68_02670, partial [Flavobacteriales bacterium]|nr:hypothetical protein [Flavobacteriales bacterium]